MDSRKKIMLCGHWFIVYGVVLSLLLNLILFPALGIAQIFDSDRILNSTKSYRPVSIRGIRVHPDNPFQFDFVIHPGDEDFNQDEFEEEAQKLIKYFLASLTVPEKDLWVNLSPYEKDRVIASGFGQTEMGRDMLSQDYLLKQFTASLMYPEKDLGAEFWDRVYQKAHNIYGTSNLPVNTFNKVWIVPEKSVVYEKGQTAFVLESKLKVMLEEDYLMSQKNRQSDEKDTLTSNDEQNNFMDSIARNFIKEILIPEIEKEVNEGKHFAPLRQIFQSLILATWYKENLKTTIINQKYSNQDKVVGVEVEDKESTQKIYQQYIEAFREGVYDYIKEDYDPIKQETFPRKYFSGGVTAQELTFSLEYERDEKKAFSDLAVLTDQARIVTADFQMINQDANIVLKDQALLPDSDTYYSKEESKVAIELSIPKKNASTLTISKLSM